MLSTTSTASEGAGRGRIALRAVVLATIIGGVAASSVAAQECRIKRFGGPNRFSAQPITTVAQLKALARNARADIEKAFAEANFEGDMEDVFAAVESGENLHERMYSPGQRFMWMALRRNGEPTVVVDECWGGQSAYEAFELQVDSRGKRYTFSIPQLCGNFALIGVTDAPEQVAAARREEERRAEEERRRAEEERRRAEEEERRRAEEERRRAEEERRRAEEERAAAAVPPPAPEPEPARSADSKWTLRLFGSFASADKTGGRSAPAVSPTTGSSLFASSSLIAGGLPFRGLEAGESDSLEVGESTGGGASIERHLSSFLGVEVGVLYMHADADYTLQRGGESSTSENEIDWIALTAGPNFHLTPDSKADVYVGPFLGWATVDSTRFHPFGERMRINFDDEVIFGAQVGVSVPVCSPRCWTFGAGLKWFQLPFNGRSSEDGPDTPKFDIDADQLLFTAGAAYRF